MAVNSQVFWEHLREFISFAAEAHGGAIDILVTCIVCKMHNQANGFNLPAS